MLERLDEKHLPHWSVFEEAFEKLDGLLDTGASQQSVAAYLATIPHFNYHLVSRRVEPQMPLYRARIPSENHNLVSTYSLPPAEKCDVNRANRAGHPVFYAAIQPDTAIQEYLAAQKSFQGNPVVYVSEWSLSKPINIKQVISGPGTLQTDFLKTYYEQLLSQTKEMFLCYSPKGQDTLIKLAVRLGDYFLRETDYRVSSEIAHQALCEPTTEEEYRIDAIAYPSRVKKHGAMNIALSSDCAKSAVLQRVFKVQVKQWNLHGSNVSVEAMGFPDGERLNWFRMTCNRDTVKLVDVGVYGSRGISGPVESVVIDNESITVRDLLNKVWREKKHEVINSARADLINRCTNDRRIVEVPVYIRGRKIVVNGELVEEIALSYSLDCTLGLVKTRIR